MAQANVYSSSVPESARAGVGHVINILLGCGVARETIETLFSEVSTTRAIANRESLSDVPMTEMIWETMVVLRWRRDPAFLDPDGLPRPLRNHGKKNEFQSLVTKVSVDLDSTKVVTNLIRAGTIRRNQKGDLELMSESIVACSGRDGQFVAATPVLDHVAGFLSSVEHNLFDKDSNTRPRFERACYVAIPTEHVPIFMNMASSRCQNFVDVVDEWLVRRSVPFGTSAGAAVVGVGAYVFVRKQDAIK